MHASYLLSRRQIFRLSVDVNQLICVLKHTQMMACTSTLIVYIIVLWKGKLIARERESSNSAQRHFLPLNLTTVRLFLLYDAINTQRALDPIVKNSHWMFSCSQFSTITIFSLTIVFNSNAASRRHRFRLLSAHYFFTTSSNTFLKLLLSLLSFNLVLNRGYNCSSCPYSACFITTTTPRKNW